MKEEIKCPVCGKSRYRKFWAMPGYRLARCKSCRMIWDFMPPENLLAQYEKRYFINENPKGGYANYVEGMAINKRTFTDRLSRIEKKYGKGRLLDVGCALGDCLIEAEKLGWEDPQGMEVSDYAYKFAKAKGLNVKKGILTRNSYKKEGFDVVMYQDVIEHIFNSVDELKKAYYLLKPGGIIFLVTPDVGGIWAKCLGPLWYHYKPDEHVLYFSQNTIRLALKKAGFKNIESAKTYHLLSLEYTLNRLRYYFPLMFELLLKIVKKTPLRSIPFKAYTGELEAWGQKPL